MVSDPPASGNVRIRLPLRLLHHQLKAFVRGLFVAAVLGGFKTERVWRGSVCLFVVSTLRATWIFSHAHQGEVFCGILD